LRYCGNCKADNPIKLHTRERKSVGGKLESRNTDFICTHCDMVIRIRTTYTPGKEDDEYAHNFEGRVDK